MQDTGLGKVPPVATVLTYTSKNEMISFDVVAGSGSSTSVSQDEATSADERKMIDMVMRSSTVYNQSSNATQLPVLSKETSRV